MTQKLNARRQNTILSQARQPVIIEAMVAYMGLAVKRRCASIKSTFIGWEVCCEERWWCCK